MGHGLVHQQQIALIHRQGQSFLAGPLVVYVHRDQAALDPVLLEPFIV